MQSQLRERLVRPKIKQPRMATTSSSLIENASSTFLMAYHNSPLPLGIGDPAMHPSGRAG